MGGFESSVTASTKDVFLESAFFNPKHIAGVARKYGLCTDSSQRYERGVDPSLPAKAIERATRLLIDIAGGQSGPVTSCVSNPELTQVTSVRFVPGRVQSLCGVHLTEDAIEATLANLGMEIVKHEAYWEVKPPLYRFDISSEEDLVEEVIRLYGYQNLEAKPMQSVAKAGKINKTETLIETLSNFLVSRGYYESISYSFVDESLQKVLYPNQESYRLLNPISQELAVMRKGLWPGLIASMIYNLHRQQSAIQLFEVGVVFENAHSEQREIPTLGGLLYGETNALSWSSGTRSFDFFDLKGDLEALFSHLHLEGIQFTQKEHPALHPGKSACIEINNQACGWIGVLHPRIAESLEVAGEVIVFELQLEQLEKSHKVQYKSISKYPQIRRDLSLLTDDSVYLSQVEQEVREHIPARWLKGFDVFDVYAGDNIPAGKKSLGIALTLQDNQRTLVDEEINEVINAIIKSLEVKFDITLRD